MLPHYICLSREPPQLFWLLTQVSCNGAFESQVSKFLIWIMGDLVQTKPGSSISQPFKLADMEQA
jgi:hypothetical protein